MHTNTGKPTSDVQTTQWADPKTLNNWRPKFATSQNSAKLIGKLPSAPRHKNHSSKGSKLISSWKPILYDG